MANCQKTTYYLVRHMRGTASELGLRVQFRNGLSTADLFSLTECLNFNRKLLIKVKIKRASLMKYVVISRVFSNILKYQVHR